MESKADFEKDIFISYAHIDDEPLVEGERGWVSEFHRSLEIRLAQLLGYRPRIWRDIDLKGNHEFSDEIISQLPGIAIMVSILSPRYVRSEWCTREVVEFIKASEKNIGITVHNRSRLFKVIKTPVSLNEHPSPIQGLLGYEFFRIDPEGKRINEFSHVFGPEAQRAYWTRLNDIAHDISTLLEELKQSVVAAGTAGAGTKGKVYLSETSHDLSENREALKRELTGHGYEVLPSQHMPLLANDYVSAARNMMNECDLIIHLFGKNYGVVPEGTDKSIIHLQAEEGAALSREKNIPRLAWLPPSAGAADPRQETLTTLLRTNEDMHSGADIIEASLEDLKFAMYDKLDALNKKQEAKEEEAGDTIDDSGPKRIYLFCDKEDLSDIGPLEDILFNEQFDVVIPVFDGDPGQVREDHQENLKLCDAVIIYYGKGNELWLRSAMRDLLKAVGYGRKKPIEKKAVFVAGPSTPQKERFRTHEALVINGINGINEENIKAFTGSIKK